MAPNPHEFRVFKALQAAMAAISVANGYHYNVEGVAVKLDPDQGVEELLAEHAPRPFVILEARAEDWDYNYGANQVVLTLPVWVHWVHEPTRSDDQALGEPAIRDDDDRMKWYWQGCADVEKAIGADPGLGGTASSIRITRRRMHEDARIWAVIETVIRLHRTFGVPSGV